MNRAICGSPGAFLFGLSAIGVLEPQFLRNTVEIWNRLLVEHRHAAERRDLASRQRMATGELIGEGVYESLVVVDSLSFLYHWTPLRDVLEKVQELGNRWRGLIN